MILHRRLSAGPLDAESPAAILRTLYWRCAFLLAFVCALLVLAAAAGDAPAPIQPAYPVSPFAAH